MQPMPLVAEIPATFRSATVLAERTSARADDYQVRFVAWISMRLTL